MAAAATRKLERSPPGVLPLTTVAIAFINMDIRRIGRFAPGCLARCRAEAAGWIRAEPLPERPLVVAAVAVAAGCGVPALVDVPVAAWWLAAVSALAIWAWLAATRRPAAAAGWLLAGVCAGAAGWATARSSLFPADDLAWSLTEAPRPVAIEGTLLESPRLLSLPAVDPLRGGASRAGPSRPCRECVVAVDAVRDGPSWRAASGRAAVIIDEHGGASGERLAAGCRLRVFGRGLRPTAPLNPGEFDFRERARSLRCLSIVRTHTDGVLPIGPPSVWSMTPWVDAWRQRGVEVLQSHLSPRQAPLAAALLLGGRESLPREESLEFLVTGTIHILSISGLHVGLLSLALFRVCRAVALARGWSLLLVACCTGLYMALVRAETPVVRATLLVWLGCLAAAVGRRALAANSLALAAIVVLAWHPPEIFRTGTQLSFLSTAVLVAVSVALPRRSADDPIERLIDRSRSPGERRLRGIARQAWELFVTGAAVWAVSAPVVAWRFHLVSPIGLILNPLIAPLVAVAMAWGFLCLLAAAVSESLAAPCGWVCDGTLRCIAALVSWSSDLPGGYFWVAGPPGWWVAGWYVILAAALLVIPRERLVRARTWVALAAAWCGCGAAAVGMARWSWGDPSALRVVVAAMGHGCGIVVRSPTGRCLVYDAGRLGAAAAARRGMAAVLWHEGVRRIDTLAISHADTDHFNAVPELIERFPIGEIVVTKPFLESDSPAVAEVLRRVRGVGIPLRIVHAGDSFPLDQCCRIRILHPHDSSHPQAAPSEGGSSARPSDNETSLVMAVDSAGRRLLLTGDLEGEALRRFVASGPGECDVLVAPHHGSRTTLPPDIARVTAADWVFISGAGGRGWSDVRQAYATARGDGRIAAVVKTGWDEHSGGAIEATLTAGDVVVRQFVAGRWRRLPAPAPPQASASIAGSGASGRVSTQPAAISSNWLATKPASNSSTPLVKP